MNARPQPGSAGRQGALDPFAGESGPAAGAADAPARPEGRARPFGALRYLRLRHRRRQHRVRHEATVSVHVRDFSQLFNSLDPSPLWNRDLDGAVAGFIEDEFRDRRAARVWRLRVYAQAGTAAAAELQSAIATYYRRLAKSARLELREHTRVGRIALLGGALIFLASTAVRGLLNRAFEHPPALLDQGLIILAWLGLWRPVETLVYGWVPFYRKRRLYERLAKVHVMVRPGPPGLSGAAPAPAALPEP